MTDENEEPESQDSQESFKDLLNYICCSDDDASTDTPFAVLTNTNAQPTLPPVTGCSSVVQNTRSSLPVDNSPAAAKWEPDNLMESHGFPQSCKPSVINHECLSHTNTANPPLPRLFEIQSQPMRPACTTNSVPSKANYPGQYGFRVSFGEHTAHAVKNTNYTHSKDVQKLYAKMNVSCPVKFHCDVSTDNPLSIRAMMVFMQEEHSLDVVDRCPSHYHSPGANSALAHHVIQVTENDPERVEYNIGKDGRASVTVQFQIPSIGDECFMVLYKFMCRSSCVGGINRRPVGIVFTLEDESGNCKGRFCTEVKICSSPGRDRKKDEIRSRKRQGMTVAPLPKKKPALEMQVVPSNHPPDEEVYFLRVVGKEKYELLSKINDALNLASLVPEAQQEQYREQEEARSTMAHMLTEFFVKNQKL